MSEHLPEWLRREFDEMNDPKAMVSVEWLRMVVEKAGLRWPLDLPKNTILPHAPADPE